MVSHFEQAEISIWDRAAKQRPTCVLRAAEPAGSRIYSCGCNHIAAWRCQWRCCTPHRWFTGLLSKAKWAQQEAVALKPLCSLNHCCCNVGIESTHLNHTTRDVAVRIAARLHDFLALPARVRGVCPGGELLETLAHGV